MVERFSSMSYFLVMLSHAVQQGSTPYLKTPTERVRERERYIYYCVSALASDLQFSLAAKVSSPSALCCY